MNDRFPQLAEPTLGRALLARARLRPEGTAAIFVPPDGPDEVWSIRALLALADRFARVYRERGAGRGAGERRPMLVAICCRPGPALHAAFLGGLLAGAVPSIVSPPSPRMEREKYVRSFVRMLDHLRPDLIVTEDEVIDALGALGADRPDDARVVDASAVRATRPAGGNDSAIDLDAIAVDEADPRDVAFLQHSSGTTGLQKGVALGHAAVLSQLRSYAGAIHLSPDDVIASWLPLYHDMGLIACFVQPMLTGVPLVEMSPFAWVNRPVLLPRKIREYRATLCWLPNFAYTFMSRSIRDSQLDEVDFGSVRAFVNCSEPVMASSHEEFAARFAGRGVSPEKLTACYAMAENVFAVTQSSPGRAPRLDVIDRDAFEREHRAVAAADGTADPTLRLVSNGRPVKGVDVRVVEKDGSPCPERNVGEICVAGTSLFGGYFRRDDLTAEALADGWYRTGDLGYLADGRLYVTGRKKDLIIVQGRNFYPTDVEAAVAELEGIVEGRVVAFGGSDAQTGTEALIVVAESREQDPALQGRIKLAVRAQIAQTFDCTLGGVHLVPPRWLIKSTSGKVARAENRQKLDAMLRAKS